LLKINRNINFNKKIFVYYLYTNYIWFQFENEQNCSIFTKNWTKLKYSKNIWTKLRMRK